MNSFELIRYFVGYYKSLKAEKAFTKKHVEPFLLEKISQLKYTFSKADWKKTTIYYPCFTVIAGAENFILLKKKRSLTHQERYRLTVVSIMSSLCDDLIDEEGWTADQLFSLLDMQLLHLPLTPKAKLILFLNENLYSTFPPNQLYEQQLRVAIGWQARSLEQLKPDISTQRILEISREKNAQTSLMFAYLLDEEWTELEKETIGHSGFMGQLVNDTYDIFKDVHAGIQTYMQHLGSVDECEDFFIAQWQKLVQLIHQSNASTVNKKHLINRFACVHGYALVAFRQFRKIEKKKGQTPDWVTASRKELIIDMEKWPTRWQLLKAIKKLSKL